MSVGMPGIYVYCDRCGVDAFVEYVCDEDEVREILDKEGWDCPPPESCPNWEQDQCPDCAKVYGREKRTATDEEDP